MEKYQFMVYYSAFLFFIIQMTVLAGPSILNIEGLTPPPAPDIPAEGIFGTIISVTADVVWIIANMTFFFTLMSVNSSIFLLGVLVLTPFSIGLLWIIIEAFNPLD